MLRINLLPPEIIERRKWERFYPYVFLAAALSVVVVLAVWFAAQLAVNQRNDVLQQTKTTTAQLTAQAEAFSIFERKQQELEARKAIADAALAGRVDMARLAEDVSLVLPDETFLINLSCDEEAGLTLAGNAAMSSAPSVKQGYKSVAATLVRLASLTQLYDVWLDTASVSKFTAFQPAARSANSSGTVMSFSVTSKIYIPEPATQAQ